MSFASSGVNGASRPKGLVAPGPNVQFDVKQGQKLEIRPGEPLNLFISAAHGHDIRLTSSGLQSSFIIAPGTQPAGVGAPRIAGQWFKISLSPGAFEGAKEEVKLQSGSSAAQSHTGLTFVLAVGGRRFY